MSEIKQVIVMRTKYPDGNGGVTGVRKGKLCAQAAHASMKIFFDRAEIEWVGPRIKMELCLTPEMEIWSTGSFAKIVVYVDTEEELLALHEKALASDLPAAIIQDSGRTEFHGKPTYTALAIGPHNSELIDKITGHLPLL